MEASYLIYSALSVPLSAQDVKAEVMSAPRRSEEDILLRILAYTQRTASLILTAFFVSVIRSAMLFNMIIQA